MADPALQRWFYEEHGQRKGPVTIEEIKEIVRDGKLSPQSLIWCSGWPAWKAVGDVAEVSNAIARTEQPARKPSIPARRWGRWYLRSVRPWLSWSAASSWNAYGRELSARRLKEPL